MFKADGIKFRSKFTQNVKFSPVGEAEFKNFFVQILNHPEEFVIGFLWSLTYDPYGSVSPKMYHPYLERLNRFTAGQRKVILNEFRHQYTKQNTGFLDVNESNLPSYQALVNSTNEVTAYVVLQKCKELSKCSPDFIQREIYFLNSEDEDKKVKAIKYLNFNTKAANFLKSYAKEIASLIKVVTSSSDVTVSNSQPDGEDRPPFSKEEDAQAQPQSAQYEATSQSTEPKTVEQQVDETGITAEVVLEHQAELTKFFQAFDILEARGLHPLEIAKLQSEIAQFFEALKEVTDLGLSADSVLSEKSKIGTLLDALTLFKK